MSRYSLMLTVLMSLLITAGVAEAQWGTLKGRVMLQGEIPETKPPLVTQGDKKAKDPDICAAEDIPNESLLIDPETKGIANVAVWLAKRPEKIHPELEKVPDKAIELQIVGCRYVPHIQVVRTNQTVKIVNRDPIFHNPHTEPTRNGGVGVVVTVMTSNGGLEPHKYPRAERLPFPIVCDIHPWMSAYWLILDHPYAAITDKDGNFEIPKLPVGEHEFKVWHEWPGVLVMDEKNPKQGLVVKIVDDKPTSVPDILVPVKTLTEKPRK